MSDYKIRLEQNLFNNCERILSILEKAEQTTECTGEPKAFFNKLIGDYYRYMTVGARGKQLEIAKVKALEAYKKSQAIELDPYHETRISLNLNLAVFYYEVLNDKKAGIALGQQTIKETINKFMDPDPEDK